MRASLFTLGFGLLSLSAPAAAQNATFIAELLEALTGANLTSLASAAASINGTTSGQRLLSLLGTSPQTVFAPNNEGFVGLLPNISSDPELLAQVLSYHVLPGTFNVTDTPSFPNTTVGRTLFNSSSLVFLEGGRSQVLAWSNSSDGVTILNQDSNVTVVNSTTVGNLTVHIIDAVIDTPGEFTSALDWWNLTAATAALEGAGLLSPLNTIHGFTLFAPSDSAFAAAQADLESIASNDTALRNVLLNHVVNGTTVYSGSLIGGGDDDVTSAAGLSIGAFFNSSGGYVSSGNATARIVQPDVILWNGVLHIIDTVLFNTESDAGAAESAASSASEAATSTSSETETGPIGFTPSPTGTSASDGGDGGQGGGSGETSAAQIALRLPAVLGGSTAAFTTVLFGAVVGALVVF